MSDITWYIENDELTHEDLPELVTYEFTSPLPPIWWSISSSHDLTTDILAEKNEDPYQSYPYPLGIWYIDDRLTHSALAESVGGEWETEDDFLNKNEPDICKEYEDCNPYLTEATPSIINNDIYGDKASWIPYFNSEIPDSLLPENDYYVCNFSPASQTAHQYYKGQLGYAVGYYQNQQQGVMRYGDLIDKSIGWSALGDYHPLATQFIIGCKCAAGGMEGRITDSLNTGTILIETRDKVDYFLGNNHPESGFGNNAPNQVLANRPQGSGENGLDYYLWGFEGTVWDYRIGAEYIAPIHMMPFIQMPLHNMLFQIRVQAIDTIETPLDAGYTYEMIDVSLEQYVDGGTNSYVDHPYIIRVYMMHFCCANETELANKEWAAHNVIQHVGVTSETELWDDMTATTVQNEAYEGHGSNPSQVMFRGGPLLMGLMSGSGENCIIQPRRSYSYSAETQPYEDPNTDGYFVTKYPRPADPDEPEPWATWEVKLHYNSEHSETYGVALVAGQPYWPEFYEDCIRAAAGFGVFFTPNTTVDGLALDDDDVFLGILDDNWVGHGDFSRGVINHAQKQWTMKTTRDSYYMSVEKGAFYNCSNLDSIRIPDSVGIIGPYAFKGTALTNVTIPENCVFYPHTFPEDCQINIRPRPVESEDEENNA